MRTLTLSSAEQSEPHYPSSTRAECGETPQWGKINDSADELIVSVSGIRGIIGRGLTPDAALSLPWPAVATLDGKPMVLCRDSRPSGGHVRHAVLAGLEAGAV